jgi:hypothetical protein
MIKLIARGVLDTPPSRSMTAVGGATLSTSLRAKRSNPGPQRKTGLLRFARNDGGGMAYTGKCGLVFGSNGSSASLSSGSTSS